MVWEGGAPIRFGKVVNVNEFLIGRPIWLVSEKQIRLRLKGELIGNLKVRLKLPWTVVIIAEPPILLGAIPKSDKVLLVNQKGEEKAEIPLFATRLPFLILPKNVKVKKCVVAINRVLEASARQGIDVKAVWVSQFGEVGIYLPKGFWIRLGNPTALDLKLGLGKALYQNKLLSPQIVADLSVPKVISLWEIERRRR